MNLGHLSASVITFTFNNILGNALNLNNISFLSIYKNSQNWQNITHLTFDVNNIKYKKSRWSKLQWNKI